MFNGVVQHEILYEYCLITKFFTTVRSGGDGDVVAQDGYSFQSEGRTPGDEKSSEVDRGHSEVTN